MNSILRALHQFCGDDCVSTGILFASCQESPVSISRPGVMSFLNIECKSCQGGSKVLEMVAAVSICLTSFHLIQRCGSCVSSKMPAKNPRGDAGRGTTPETRQSRIHDIHNIDSSHQNRTRCSIKELICTPLQSKRQKYIQKEPKKKPQTPAERHRLSGQFHPGSWRRPCARASRRLSHSTRCRS